MQSFCLDLSHLSVPSIPSMTKFPEENKEINRQTKIKTCIKVFVFETWKLSLWGDTNKPTKHMNWSVVYVCIEDKQHGIILINMALMKGALKTSGDQHFLLST